jgi:hypothetical protein
MRIVATFFLSVFLVASSAQAKRSPQNPPAKPQTPPLQSAPPSGQGSASTDQVKIDPAKEADIHRLLDLAGTEAAMTQIMDMLEKNMRPWVTGSLPDGDYRDKLVDLFLQKYHDHVKAEIQLLVDSAVPLYDKYFSAEDIKGLIQFYRTPLGQKAVSVLPKLSLEMQAGGMRMGGKLADQCITEVLSEHPELQKALEEAQTGAPPQ